MKKTLQAKSKSQAKRKEPDQLKPEYRFNDAAAKPNRFAGRIRKGSVAVLLDPDVAELFRSAESVNAALRALMTTMPAGRV
jgi:hypothetical protein